MEESPTDYFLVMDAQYRNLYPKLDQFAIEVSRQLEQLLEKEGISLAVPIQHRVKDWDSTQAKLERKQRLIENITDLSDLVGMRMIVLFRRDIEKVCTILETHFQVLEREDTQERLEASQFGYTSIHYIIELSPPWLAVPSMAELGGIKAEVQVRTASQHIWATASHIGPAHMKVVIIGK